MLIRGPANGGFGQVDLLSKAEGERGGAGRSGKRIKALSQKHARNGYRMIAQLLWAEGWSVNGKRVQRILRGEGLQVVRQRRKIQRQPGLGGAAGGSREAEPGFGRPYYLVANLIRGSFNRSHLVSLIHPQLSQSIGLDDICDYLQATPEYYGGQLGALRPAAMASSMPTRFVPRAWARSFFGACCECWDNSRRPSSKAKGSAGPARSRWTSPLIHYPSNCYTSSLRSPGSAAHIAPAIRAATSL